MFQIDKYNTAQLIILHWPCKLKKKWGGGFFSMRY